MTELQKRMAARKAAAGSVTTPESKTPPVAEATVPNTTISTPTAVKTAPAKVAPTPKRKASAALLKSLGNAAERAAEVKDFENAPAGTYPYSRIIDVRFDVSNTDSKTGKIKDATKPQRDMFVIDLLLNNGKDDQGSLLTLKETLFITFGGTKAETWAAKNAKTMYTYMERFGVDISTDQSTVDTLENMIDQITHVEIKEGVTAKGVATRNVYLHALNPNDHLDNGDIIDEILAVTVKKG